MTRIEALALIAAAAAFAGCGSSGHTAGSSPAGEKRAASSNTGSTRSSGGEAKARSSTSSSHARGRTAQPPIRIGKLGKPLAPQKVAVAALTTRVSESPAVICALSSKRFLHQAYGGAQGCRAAVRSGGLARSLDVRSVRRSGDIASVVAVPNGGPSSGERLEVRLVRHGLTWRIDAVRSNAKVGP